MFTVLAISEYSLGEGNGNPLQCSLPGESQGGGSLVGRCLWGRTESDTTEATQQQQQQQQQQQNIVYANYYFKTSCY